MGWRRAAPPSPEPEGGTAAPPDCPDERAVRAAPASDTYEGCRSRAVATYGPCRRRAHARTGRAGRMSADTRTGPCLSYGPPARTTRVGRTACGHAYEPCRSYGPHNPYDRHGPYVRP
ncbi:hypothetical protein GCM10009654_44000 [Streptomyces hebeiensis]|uniref:Uncharacterized protein n=1 Tax=Streptomyces hebeiensis TaxID=229486 RepID=A0ABN1V108_9ACTN